MAKFIALPFVTAFLKMLRDMADFRGRMSRHDYWWAVLGTLIFSVPFLILNTFGGVLGTILYAVYILLIAMPVCAATIRRLHDTGKSALWLLLCLTVLGCILITVWLCTEGDAGDNQYGSDPQYDYSFF